MKSAAYDVNGVRLHVWEAGPASGTPLFFLHGFPEAGFDWEKQVRYFAEKGYCVYAPDQRGYNRSSKPQAVSAYRMEHLVTDMAVLIQQVTAEKVVLAGHDWGGGVAWHLAMQHPHLLEKLVILNMPHPEVMRQTLLHNGRQRLKSSYAGFFQIPLLPEWLARRNNFRMLEKSMVASAVPDTFTPEMMMRYRHAWRKPGALTSMINWYRAYSFARPKKSSPIQVPVLILWGLKDAFLLSEMATASKAHCTNSTLILLDDCSHWLHHEKPERVCGLIAGFMEEKVPTS